MIDLFSFSSAATWWHGINLPVIDHGTNTNKIEPHFHDLSVYRFIIKIIIIIIIKYIYYSTPTSKAIQR